MWERVEEEQEERKRGREEEGEEEEEEDLSLMKGGDSIIGKESDRGK